MKLIYKIFGWIFTILFWAIVDIIMVIYPLKDSRKKKK